MPVQIFRLRNVPDDEAEDIRNLLTKHNIQHYETPAGNWGISMPAIWLHDDDQLEEARSLIDEYQKQRSERNRNEAKPQESMLSGLFENPVRFILYIAFAAVIAYFSIKPFLNFGQ